MNIVLGETRTLPVAPAALLWCMRMWVLELSRGVEAEPAVTDMLQTLGVADIAPTLRELVETLSTTSTRMIEVQCTCQKRLSADERALLDVLSLAQALDFSASRRLLSRFVTPAGAEVVIEKADAIGTALLYAGHSLPAIEGSSSYNELPKPFHVLPASHDTVH